LPFLCEFRKGEITLGTLLLFRTCLSAHRWKVSFIQC
jgi:hypothetical protein